MQRADEAQNHRSVRQRGKTVRSREALLGYPRPDNESSERRKRQQSGIAQKFRSARNLFAIVHRFHLGTYN
jgi:hypothetical protein